MLVLVNEFAVNLRDGKTTLPLDNRSAELLKSNKILKDNESEMKLKLEMYERQISGGSVEAGPFQYQDGSNYEGGSQGMLYSHFTIASVFSLSSLLP